MAGPGDEMAAGAAGRGPMRASHADREQVIEALKDEFVHGRLTKDELDARAGRALAARTCAELAALTADIPPASGRVRAGPARWSRPARRPLARAAAGSGGCLALAAAAVGASFILDPGGPGADRSWAGLMVLLAQYAVIAGVWILWSGVATSVQQRRSGRQLPPRPGPGGHARDGGRRGGTGRGPVPPAPAPTRPAPTCGLTAHGLAGHVLLGGIAGCPEGYERYRMPCNRPPSPFSLARSNVCGPGNLAPACGRPPPPVCSKTTGPDPASSQDRRTPARSPVRHPNSPVMTWTESSHGHG